MFATYGGGDGDVRHVLSFKGLTMNTSKTGRTRGVVLKVIREVAGKRKRFKITDLVPPLTFIQARCSLNLLIKNGEIVRAKSAYPMGNGWWLRAIYQRTEHLRPPELTNKQL